MDMKKVKSTSPVSSDGESSLLVRVTDTTAAIIAIIAITATIAAIAAIAAIASASISITSIAAWVQMDEELGVEQAWHHKFAALRSSVCMDNGSAK